MNSKEKGARGERELAAKLRFLGMDARRGQQYSGANGDADVIGLPGVHIECKRTERLRIYEAYEQSKRDAARVGDVPTVIHRKNGEEWLVTMSLEHFISFYKAWERGTL